MVGLTSTHFTVISALCSLAAVSIPATANAAAVHTTSKHPRVSIPTIPLPLRLLGKKHSGKGREVMKSGKKKGKHHKERIVERGHNRDDEIKIGLEPLVAVDIQKRHGHDHDHDHVHRRSSIVIPSSQGGSYVISHDRRSPHDDNKAVVPHVHGHRRRDALGISGTIDIVGAGPLNRTRIASLILESNMTSPFVLNASGANGTRVNLVYVTSGSSGSDQDVIVKVQVFSQDSSAPLCATFDPSPAQAMPLTALPCSNGVELHKSQNFVYNMISDVIRPMWFSGQDDGTAPDPVAPDHAGVASITGDTDTNGNLTSRDTPVPEAQNVTLVFVPFASQARLESIDSDPDSKAFVTTVTVTASTTETVIATVTSTATAAAMDATLSSTMTSSSDATSTSESPSAADVDLMSTTTSLITSSSASPSSVGALGVEIVGLGPSSVSESVTTSASTSSTEPSPSSVDAEAIASSIAASATATTSFSSAATTSTIAVADVDSGMATNVAVEYATMTPVSTMPYDWMFRAEPRL